MFETKEGAAHLVDVPTLSRLLRAGTQSSDAFSSAAATATATATTLQLVFVASCHSLAVGEAFLRAGVSHVVCVKREEKVLDRASIVFSKAFYHSLFTGRHSVTHAFEIAQARVCADGSVGLGMGGGGVEADKFVYLRASAFHVLPSPTASNQALQLLPPPNSPPSASSSEPAFFAHISDGAWLDVAQPCLYHQLPAACSRFVGRNCELYQALSLVIRHRLLTVRGAPGIGKTSLTRQIAHFCLQRRVFRAGVLYASFRGHDTPQSVLITLLQTIRKEIMRVCWECAGSLPLCLREAKATAKPEGYRRK